MRRKLMTIAAVAALGLFGPGSAVSADPGGGTTDPPPENPPCEDVDHGHPAENAPQCQDDGDNGNGENGNGENGDGENGNGENGNGEACTEEGLVSAPVHDDVEPVAGGVDPALQDGVHEVNCNVVVPVEDALGL